MGSDEPTPNLSEEQKERATATFAIRPAPFERSYRTCMRRG